MNILYLVNILSGAQISLQQKLTDLYVFLFPETLSVADGGGGVQDVDRGQTASEHPTWLHSTLGLAWTISESEIILISH